MCRYILTKLINRLKEVDLNDVVTDRPNEVLFHHITLFYEFYITLFYEFYSKNADKYGNSANVTA